MKQNALSLIILIFFINNSNCLDCSTNEIYAAMPTKNCKKPTDPNNRPKSKLENWFTKKMFNDLFPVANLGRGPHPCLPYSYESFIIAARYFRGFGTTSGNKIFNETENYRRDVAAFFAHAIQETGANNLSYYQTLNKKDADNCFYRGGLFNWFEGGQFTPFFKTNSPRTTPQDGGKSCSVNAKYCSISKVYPCDENACYFGRGAIQISYNYNYGLFQKWLKSQNITVNLLKKPNLIMTNVNPPLALMASLWFYMTPQPPKPAMHDIVLGRWYAGEENQKKNYSGPIFGPTSLIINNECHGEDSADPGSGGENRRIKAFKWFCNYFKIRHEKKKFLTCKNMPQRLSDIKHNLSYAPDWSTAWKNDQPCKCVPVSYQGVIPYYQPKFYPKEFVKLNKKNKELCEKYLYQNPAAMDITFKENCRNFKQKKKIKFKETLI